MSQYKRHYQRGGYYFFTLVTYNRKLLLTKPENVIHIKNAMQKIKQEYPFNLNAIVLLPDHLHCIWELPKNDHDFSTRWRLIKRYVSIEIDAPINHRNEKKIWQSRFWEHCIRDEEDWQKHMDYIHYNPVKHGYVTTAKAWPHSSFNYWLQKGLYDDHWGSTEPTSIVKMKIE